MRTQTSWSTMSRIPARRGRLTAVGWRDCRLLEFVFNDSSDNLDHSAMVSALAIINSVTNGVRFAISNNEIR